MSYGVRNEETIKVFTERVKGLLKRTGSTNAEIKRAMDISQPTFRNVMQGRAMPTLDFVMKIADFFGVSVDYLVGRCDTEGRQGDYDFEEIRLESYERYLRHRRTESGLRVRIARANADGYGAPWPYNLAEEIIGEPFPCVMTRDQKEGLVEASKHLSEREQEFIWLYYKCGYTLEEIGEKYALGKERVRQVIGHGVRKMQHSRLADMVRYGYSGVMLRGENERLEKENLYLEGRNTELRARIEENTKLCDEFCRQLEEGIGHSVVDLPALDISLEELDLSIRAFNCLHRAGCGTVGDIVKLVREDPCGLERIRNLGKHTKQEIKERLLSFGIDISKFEDEKREETA